MLFNEPKLLKYSVVTVKAFHYTRFSALQRAEIAEIRAPTPSVRGGRAPGFSALQRAEIAEMRRRWWCKSGTRSFSALQRAEIAEMANDRRSRRRFREFQCSSTSRNC